MRKHMERRPSCRRRSPNVGPLFRRATIFAHGTASFFFIHGQRVKVLNSYGYMCAAFIRRLLCLAFLYLHDEPLTPSPAPFLIAFAPTARVRLVFFRKRRHIICMVGGVCVILRTPKQVLYKKLYKNFVFGRKWRAHQTCTGASWWNVGRDWRWVFSRRPHTTWLCRSQSRRGSRYYNPENDTVALR